MATLLENLVGSLSMTASNTLTMISTMVEASWTRVEKNYTILVTGYAAAMGVPQARRILETYYVLIKADLDLPGACQQAHASLLAHLQNDNMFSAKFVEYFTNDSLRTPLNTDPAQIITIKKILLALYHLDSAFQKLEEIDVSPARNTIALVADLLPILISDISTLNTELQVLYESSVDVGMMVGSYLGSLNSKLNTLGLSLNSVNVKNIPLPSLGGCMQLLPQEAPRDNMGLNNLSALVYQMPAYFQDLNQLINPEFKKKEGDTPEILQKKAGALADNLNALISPTETALSSLVHGLGKGASSLAGPQAGKVIDTFVDTGIGITGAVISATTSSLSVLTAPLTHLVEQGLEKALPPGVKDKFQYLMSSLQTAKGNMLAIPDIVSITVLLVNQLPALIETANPLAKDVKNAIEALLDKLRHDYFPEVLAELEGIEEHFSLRPDFLVAPTLESMKDIYKQLSELYDGVVITSNLLDVGAEVLNNPGVKLIRGTARDVNSREKLTPAPGLDELCDNKFFDVVLNRRVARWIETDFAVRDTTVIEAAIRFFDTAEELWDRLLDSISADTMAKLQEDYKIIQPYYAKIAPEMDMLFVNDPQEWLERLQPKNALISMLKQDKAQEKFKYDLIQQGAARRDQLYRPASTAYRDFKAYVHNDENMKKRAAYAAVMKKTYAEQRTKALGAVGDKPEYKSPLQRALAEKPSEKLRQFMNDELKSWAEKSLDPDIFKRLTFDPKEIPETVIKNNELQTFTDTQPALLYKKLVFALDVIQKALAQLEQLNEKGLISHEAKGILSDLAPWVNIYYASLSISEAVSSPQLNAIISKGLECLAPLENIPGVGDYVKSMRAPPATASVSHDNSDIYTRWMNQQALVEKTLAWKSAAEPGTAKDVASINTASAGVDSTITPSTNIDTPDSTLLDIATALYKTPQLIRKFNPALAEVSPQVPDELNEKAKALVAALTISGINLDALKNILSGVNKLNDILSSIGFETNRAVVAMMKDAETKLGLELMSLVDDAEFQLCLKPGTLSNPLSDTLNDFYHTLITDFPFSLEDKLELITDRGLVDGRMKREEQRLKDLPEQGIAKVEIMHKALTDGYEQLGSLGDAFLNPDHFDKSEENIRSFLDAYQTLQPFLSQIKPVYDSVYFLRELQTPQDFKKCIDDVQAMKEKMFLLVEREKDNFDEMCAGCIQRIEFFKLLQEKQVENNEKNKSTFIIELVKKAFRDAEIELNESKKSNPADPAYVVKANINPCGLNQGQRSENITDIIQSMRTKWDDVLVNKICEKACASNSSDIDRMIKENVKDLYLNYSRLMEQYQELQIMEASASGAQKSDTINNIIKIINQAKEKLLDNTVSPTDRLIKKSFDDYKEVIELYVHLSKMSAYIQTHPSASPEDNAKKIAALTLMKTTLLDDKPPEIRLKNVALYGLTDDCQKILNKNSDGFFMRQFNQLKKMMFKILSQEEQHNVDLHKKFNQFKERHKTQSMDTLIDGDKNQETPAPN